MTARAVRPPVGPIRRTRLPSDHKQRQFWARQAAARANGYRRISRAVAAGVMPR